jgi:hypothetical protein
MPSWSLVCSRLADGGRFVEGTCDELGRLATWVTLDATGPQTLTLAARLGSLDRPSDLAERLPKALIHRNVPGQPVHALLCALDRAWDVAAPYAAFGPRQRWVAAVGGLRQQGIEVRHGPTRWRLGELTVAWSSVG